MEQENLNKGTPPPETAAPEVQQAVPEYKPNPPKSGKPAQPKKELTPAELQKRKKMLIMPLFFLIFGAALWLIFAPSGKDKEKEAQQAGLNVELPMPKDEGLVSDKRDAYEREAMQQKQQERMRSLQDFSVQLGEAEQHFKVEEERQVRTVSQSPEYYEAPSRPSSTTSVQSSVNAYQDINKQLGSWYDEPAANKDQQAQPAVESRIQELERKLDEEAQRKRAQEEQLQFMEKSYQMAAKYMPQSTGQATQGGETTAAGSSGGQSGKVVAQPVKQVQQNVVSLLAAPMDNAEFVEAYSKPRNLGFLTAAGNEGVQDKNSIRACVYQTVTLTNGKEVQIRLLEPMRAGDLLIPANTIVTGACRIGGERMDVSITSIQYADNIIPVELLVYDTDGQRGIFVPGNDEVKAAKEVASTLANSAGSSIMISDNAGSQLAADMGKGLIQGASQYVSKKMSVVKITLKANYRLLLLPKTQ
ncbi:MAG: conjugative transposon protein TraM [Dysgonamonadaceae bacterium]|jgi:conjugative transposon TraM protein|nr:conjugative transposon protein TraM [Dysgonamonadaceae bacterium]